MGGTFKWIPSTAEARKELVILSYDAKVDQFMHNADIFDSAKRLVREMKFSFIMSKDNPEEVINGFKKAKEAQGEIVTACFIVGEPRGIFIDTTVQTISTGSHWGLLADYLCNFGIEYTFQLDG